MKSFPILAFVLLSFFTNTTRAATDVDVVRAQVKGFYHWYIHELNQNLNSEPRKSPTIHRYITKRFLDTITKEEKRSNMDGGSLEADPFLMAQDWDKAWENNIRIKDMDPDGKKWRVQVELSGKEMNSHRLNLILVTEDGAWKIDKISDGDTR